MRKPSGDCCLSLIVLKWQKDSLTIHGEVSNNLMDTYFSNSPPLMRNTKKVGCEILQRSQSFPSSEEKLSLFTKQEPTLLGQTRCPLVHIDLE